MEHTKVSTNLQIIHGDARSALQTAGVPDGSVHCCVTSPPFWGLRKYLKDGDPNQCFEIGQEKTPVEYVANIVAVMAEVWRVLREDGTLWLNLGDSYAGIGRGAGDTVSNNKNNHASRDVGSKIPPLGCKQKDLVGIPWRVAFALQAAGWYLRSDIIWAKANCMPESVTDRPTRAHEYLFLLSKSRRYYYDHEAIKEPCIYDVDGTGTAARKARAKEHLKSFPTAERAGIRAGGYKNSVNFDGKNRNNEKQRGHSRRHDGFNSRWDAMEKAEQCTGMRNKRDVWTVAPANYPEAHFATYPPALIRPCIRAGCPVGGTVLDPFGGSGTTAQVALEEGRSAIVCELNCDYLPLIQQRTTLTPGLALA